MGSFRHSTIDLRGHTVIGTGASSGTGADTALGCASADGNTAVNYSGNRQGAERIVKEIEDLGVRAFYHQADVRREEDVQAMARTAVDTWGTVDILVNNAGVQKDAPFLDMTLEDWNTVISINLSRRRYDALPGLCRGRMRV